MIVKAIIYDEKKMLKFGHKYKPDIIILDKGATEFLYHFKHYKVDMSCAWYYKRFFRLAAKLIYCVGNENPLNDGSLNFWLLLSIPSIMLYNEFAKIEDSEIE